MRGGFIDAVRSTASRPDADSKRWRIEMKKIVLATAAFLFASGMAFAGSDHYGSEYNYDTDHDYSMVNPSAAPDNTYSVDRTGIANMSTVDSAQTVGGNSSFDYPAPGYGRGIWGR
jgi:hypothetical protein